MNKNNSHLKKENHQKKDEIKKDIMGKKREENEKNKIEELTIDLKRLQAEFENYRKRSEKENEDFRKFSNANLIEQLLPVLDSLEQGIKHNKEFTMVYEQLYSILKKNRLLKIEVNVGDDFDHETMDCLMQETNEKLKDGQVTQVLSTGYKINDKILRTTKIAINKLKKENDESENKNEKKEEK